MYHPWLEVPYFRAKVNRKITYGAEIAEKGPLRLSDSFAERVAEDFTQIIKLNELLDLAISDRWPSRKGKIQNQRSTISILDDIEAPRQRMDF